MAPSPSPQLSPAMGGSQRVVDRHHSTSPQPQQQQQPQSKRDKKRFALADRLAEITSQFSANRDVHYREQLQALQIDMNLIMEADAHGKSLLPNIPQEVDLMVKENVGRTRMKNVAPRAGRVYMDFAREINDAMEDRDGALTMHEVSFSIQSIGLC